MGHDRADATDEAAVVPMGSFPNENPNPVMRVARDGTVLYANRASEPILRALEAGGRGDRLPDRFTAQLATSTSENAGSRWELASDHRTYAILAVHQPEFDAWNVYGTDITGAKVVEKFPDRNPNPVLRMSPDGALIYANTAAGVITRTLGTVPGELLPVDLLEQIREHLDNGDAGPILVAGEGCIYRLDPVLIPEFRFINLYGTDVTAMHAMTAFPDENPNPVLRIDREAILVYANPASDPVLAAFGAEVGRAMSENLLRRLRAVASGPAPNTLEIESGGRLYELRVVTLPQFESLNLYGSDVTAAREVKRLLLNILPASIAERLQHGESMIADRFEEMAVLFADVVDFTPFSARRPPTEVVAVLNEVFTIFDRLADRYGLEKIKTIGDAYMVAGGLTPEGGKVEQVADMALDMLDAMRDYRTGAGDTLQVRVGLHIGPAVAGIIGLKKFIYDIWGDTVNTASRLESYGVPGRVQVTAGTAERLASGYVFEPRGTIEIKGKGPVEVCFIVARG